MIEMRMRGKETKGMKMTTRVKTGMETGRRPAVTGSDHGLNPASPSVRPKVVLLASAM